MASTTDFIVKNGIQVSSNLVVGSYTLQSTPVTNGAIISGRVGIGTSQPLEQLHVAGNVRITNSGQVGNLSVTNTTAATSTTSGALTVAGGVGIAGNVFAGSNMLVAGQVGIGTTLAASTLYVAGKQIISNVLTSNTMVYTGKSLDISAQEIGPGNPFFSPDGKILYFSGAGGNDVTVFTLTTPWDISTAAFLGQSASLAAQNGNPYNVFFDPTGKKMWMSGIALTNNMYGVYEYDLSIPWNIFPNSLSYSQSNLNVTSSNTGPRQISWKPDGTALFVLGNNNTGTNPRSIMEFRPATPWTLAGMSNTVVNSFSVAGQETAPTGLSFTNDGSTMLVSGSTGDDITLYDLSEPWNITTARHRTQFSLVNLVSNITVPTGAFLKPDGSAIYVTNDLGSGTGNVVIYQFDLGNNSRFDLVGNSTMSGDVLMLQNATVAGQLTGWQANFNGNVGIGTTTASYGLDVASSALFRSNVSISNTIAATSTTTGALTVAGGIGVAGNIYVGGTLFGVANASVNASNIVVTNTSTNATFYPTFVEATSGNIGVRTGSSLTFNPSTNQLSLTGNAAIQNSMSAGNLAVTNTTAATSTTTGALTVAGGVGIANGIVAGGNVGIGTSTTTGYTNAALAVYGNIQLSNVAGRQSSIRFPDGSILSSANIGNVVITNSSDVNQDYYMTFVGATSGNSAIRVDTDYTYNPFTTQIKGVKWAGSIINADVGGTGLGSISNGSLLRGGNDTQTLIELPIGTLNQILVSNGDTPVWGAINLSNATITTGILPVSRGGTSSSITPVSGAMLYSTSDNIRLASTSQLFFDNITGNFGLGISAPTQLLDVRGSIYSTGNLWIGNIAVTNTTVATSSTTGALTVAGGVGIGGNLFVAGNLIVNGNISYINSNIVVIDDPSIAIGTGPNGAPLTTSDSYDRGLEYHYYSGGGDRYGFIGWQNSTGQFVYINNATAGSSTGIYSGSLGDVAFGNITIGSASNTPKPSTSTSTGALIIQGTGGIGVGGNLYVGGRIFGVANTAFNASNLSVINTTTNAAFYPTFVEATSGNIGIRVDTGLTYNPSTDILTSGTFTATSLANGGFQGITTDSATQPSFTWTGALTSGMWYDSTTVAVNTTVSGTNRFSVQTNQLRPTVPIGLGDDAYRGPILTFGAITGGTDYVDGTYTAVTLTGGNGAVASANITVTNSSVSSVTLVAEGARYIAGDVLSVANTGVGGSGTGFSVPVATVRNAAINIYGLTTGTLPPRIRLMSSDTSVGAGQELGTVLFGSMDSNTGGRGDKVWLQGVAAGTSGGGQLRVYASLNAGEPTLSLTVNASSASFPVQIISTLANNTADGGGQIYLNGTGNRIDWNTSGVAPPAFTTRSEGTKLVLYPSLSGGAVDYALGIDSGTLWFSVGDTARSFKWYGGTTLGATLTGAGALTLTGALSTTNGTFSGNISTSSTTASTSSTTGALTVAGGVGIANGIVTAGNVGIGTSTTVGYTNNVLAVFGRALYKGNVYVTNSSTISGIIFSDGTFQNTASVPTINAFSASNVTVTATTTNATFYPTFVEATSGNIGVRTGSSLTFNPSTNQLSLTGNAWIQNSGRFGNLSVTNTTTTTSSTTGALTVAGGIGASGNIFTPSSIWAGNLSVTNTTASTSTTTGALTVAGGIGVAGNIYVGGTLFGVANASVNASNIVVTATTTNATFYPTFVEATTGNIGIRGDTALTYNPSTDALTAGQFIPSSSTAPSNGVFLPAANTLGFATNSGEKVRLTSSGNLLVGGTTDGAFKLEVTNFGLGTAANSRILGGRFTTSSGNGDYLEIMNVRNQVGGTTWTSAGWRLQQKVDTTWMGYIQFNGTSSNVGVGTTNNYGITFGAGSDSVDPNAIPEAMRITSIGRVGIGTTIPGALLDVGTFNTSNPNIITGSLEVQPYALNNAHIGENVYYDGSKFAYRRTGAAGLFYFAGAEGGFRWALSGTAGANAGMASYQLKTASDGTFAVGPAVSGSAGVYTGATLFVNPTGQVGIGTSSVYGSAQLTVIGNVYTASSAWIGNVSVTNATAATSTTTGALTVAGGVGVVGNIYVGGTLFGVANASVNASNIVVTNTSTNATFYPTFVEATSGNIGVRTGSNLTFNPSTNQLSLTGNAAIQNSMSAGNLAVTNTTASTSSTSGALTVAGGVGISGNVFAGSNVFVSGNVGIGTTLPVSGYVLTVNGGLAATTKSFVIPHPTRSGMKLQYASLEGPENGVYIRGKLDGDDVIELPDYWKYLVDPDTITVHLTPYGSAQSLYVKDVNSESITVASSSWLKSIKCFYTVYAERKDVPKLTVEI